MLPLTPQTALAVQQPLMEQGFQSVHLTELSSRINTALDSHFPVSFLFDYPTIEQLVNALLEHRDTFAVTAMNTQHMGLENAPCQSSLDVAHPSLNQRALCKRCCRHYWYWLPFPRCGERSDAFWDLLMAEKNLVREVPEDRRPVDRHRVDKYPDSIKVTLLMIRGVLTISFLILRPLKHWRWTLSNGYFCNAAGMHLRMRGLTLSSGGVKSRLYLGMSTIDYDHILQRSGDPDALNAYRLTGNAPSIAAGRIAHLFNFNGPVITLDTACSSSLVAVHYALGDLRSGACDLAIVGGVNLILDGCTSAALTSMQALSSTGQSKAFPLRLMDMDVAKDVPCCY
ncbi:beta-ketoacyl synthase N-terminal-like domain-containing protein [Vibrio sp. PP-XX7]